MVLLLIHLLLLHNNIFRFILDKKQRMDRQEFFQSYMDHWGLADVLLDCYVDLLTMEMMDENNKITRMVFFKQLLSEHHIKCKEQQVFEDEIRQLEEEIQRFRNK
jgi:hypothetical protein